VKTTKPDNFARSAITLMTGTVAAQAIPILVSPILTRLYGPEDFGVLALYMSVSSLIAVIATGRYELAIMLPKLTINALNLVVFSVAVALLVSLVATVAIFFGQHQLLALLKNPQMATWLYLLPVTGFLRGSYQALSYWSTRHDNYKLVAFSRMSLNLGAAAINIGMGLYMAHSNGLVVGTVMGQWLGSSLLLLGIWPQLRRLPKIIRRKRTWWLARRYKNFPLINAPQAFVGIAKENAVNILISSHYSASILGMYYLTLRMMLMPVSIMGSSVAQVFFSKASKAYNANQDISPLVRSLMLKLFLLGVVPITILYFFATDIFKVVFGQQWAIAGAYASWFSPYVLCHFIGSPLGMVPLVVGKQKIALCWGILEGVLFVGVFFFGHQYFHELGKTIQLLSSIMPIYYIGYYLWINHIAKTKRL
jgi:O-antigen/teichoic acid export membrane protein